MRSAILLAPALLLVACGDDARPRAADPVVPPETSAALTDRVDEPLIPNAVVRRVVDGDTLMVEIAGQTERVRLIGIDTPESVAENRPQQCYGAEAADYLTTLLPEGTPVTLVRDVEARDRFERLLAYVIRSDDGLFVNLDLVANGYAGPLTYPPNDFYSDVLVAAAAAAAEAGAGLWSVCGGPDVPLG